MPDVSVQKGELAETELLLFCKQMLPRPESVQRSFGEKVFKHGKAIFAGGLVKEIRLEGSRLEGLVRSPGGRHSTSWEVTPRGLLRLDCSCRVRVYCEHQVALYLAAYLRRPRKRQAQKRPQPEAPLRTEPTSPSLSLRLEKGVIRLEAELVGAGGLRWPISETIVRHQVDHQIVICDLLLMKSVRERIDKAGFHPTGNAGHFLLDDPFQLDSFLSISLPSWQQEYSLKLDTELISLLERKQCVRPRLSLESQAEVDWFEMSWRLEINDQRLDDKDVQALKGFLGDYFRTRDGRVVAVDSRLVHRQLEELGRIGYSVELGGAQPLRMHHLNRVMELHSASCTGPAASKLQIERNLERLYRRLVRLEKPPEVSLAKKLRKSLRPYQKEGVDFLHFLSSSGLNGILADDMGLGKTVQTLALLEVYKKRHGRMPSLVVCPTSVTHNWLEESARFTPGLKSIHATDSLQLRQIELAKFDLIVISYGLLRRNNLSTPLRFVILDEAQRIKNPRTRVARAAKSLTALHRLALTGTPIENSVTELWSIFDFLMPGFLGTLHHFESRYTKPIMKRRNQSRLNHLISQVRPFILRRVKEKVALELPPKTEQTIYCELQPRQKVLYEEVVARVRRDIGKEISAQGWEKSQISVLAALTRLRQLCCHAALWDEKFREAGSSKMETALELVDSILAAGHRVVLFSQFVRLLKILQAEVKKRGIPYLYLDGASRNRGELIDSFQRRQEHRLFLMSLKAGGTGVTLTAADYVILYEPWWNPAVENQAIDRIHRIGQEKPVTAYRLIASGTIEEKMMQLKDRKRDLADQLLQDDLEGLRQLTPEDLQFLLS